MSDQNSMGQRQWRNQVNGPQAPERADEESFSEDQQQYLNAVKAFMAKARQS